MGSIRLSAREARVINAMRKNTGVVSVVQGDVVKNVAATAPKVRTFATKAERKAGNGFSCPNCARQDLRVAPVVGRSFHDKDVKGNPVVCDLRV